MNEHTPRPPFLRRGALVALTLVLTAGTAHAQADDEPLVGDRPDFTESAVTISPGRFQVEAGVTHTSADDVDTLEAGEVLLRIGLGERLELRVGLGSYARVDPARGADVTGITDASLGVKFALGQAAGWTTAVLAGTSVPTGSNELRNPDWQPGVIFAAQRGLTETVSLGTNVGYARASTGRERYDEWSTSASLGVALDDRTGAFFEIFGILPSDTGGPETYFFDAGLTRALGPDLQLDLKAGVGLNSAAADFFAGVGVVWRR